MKLVQTSIGEEEYQLLRARAAKEGKSLKQVARDAVRTYLLPDRVDPKDAVFHSFPLVRRKGKVTWDSRDHDELLYGKGR